MFQVGRCNLFPSCLLTARYFRMSILVYTVLLSISCEAESPFLGLSRRFAIEDAFYFDDFSTDELRQILEFKLKDQNLQATEEAKKVALEVLNRASKRPRLQLLLLCRHV